MPLVNSFETDNVQLTLIYLASNLRKNDLLADVNSTCQKNCYQSFVCGYNFFLLVFEKKLFVEL